VEGVVMTRAASRRNGGGTHPQYNQSRGGREGDILRNSSNRNNHNSSVEFHASISDLIGTNDAVLQRLATSTIAMQNLRQENVEMKAIVISTRDQLLQLILTNDSVLHRLATSTESIQKLGLGSKDMKAVVVSTRDQLLQLSESIKRSEELEKKRSIANLARMQSERDRARNQESRMQKELLELRGMVQEQELELEQRSVSTPTSGGDSTTRVQQNAAVAAADEGQFIDPQRIPPATDFTAGQKQDSPSFNSIQKANSPEQMQRSPPPPPQQQHPLKNSNEKQPAGAIACIAKPSVPPQRPPQVHNEELIESQKLGDTRSFNEQIVVAGMMPATNVHATELEPPPDKHVDFFSRLPSNKGVNARSKCAVVEISADDDSHKKKKDEQKALSLSSNSKNTTAPLVPSQQPVENEPESHPSVESSSSSQPCPAVEAARMAIAEQLSLPRDTAKPPPARQRVNKQNIVVGEIIIVNNNSNNNKAETVPLPADHVITVSKRERVSPEHGGAGARNAVSIANDGAGAVARTSLNRQTSKNGEPSDSRLSLYLYPKQQNRSSNNGKAAATSVAVSPIFDLLQNQSTLETGRTLLRYEGEMWTRKRELSDLEKKKKAVEMTVLNEQKQDTTYDTEISSLHRERRALEKAMGRWNPLLKWWDKGSDDDDDDVRKKEPVGNKDSSDGDNDEDGDGDNDEDGDGNDDGKEDADDDGKEQSGAVDDEGISGLTPAQRQRNARKMVQKEENRKMRATMTKHAKGVRMNYIIEEIKRIEKLKKKVPKHVASLNQRIALWDQAIDSKVLLIEELRAKLAEIKGVGSHEDENFDMDDSRDENGHTFLMVAAQNNDMDTAQLCLTLNAQPNATSPEGHTAMVFAYYFGFNDVVTLIAQNGGTYPAKLAESWNSVERSVHALGEKPVDWNIMLRIAQQAAIPTESVLASARALEKSEETRMPILPKAERTRPASFFGACLVDPKHVLRRVILLDESVYNWYFGTSVSEKLAFVAFLDSLDRLETFQCRRRAVVGLKNAYEVNCAALESKRTSPVALFTPFVASVVDGVCDVGIIVSSCLRGYERFYSQQGGSHIQSILTNLCSIGVDSDY
jgi:hypothetical protein